MSPKPMTDEEARQQVERTDAFIAAPVRDLAPAVESRCGRCTSKSRHGGRPLAMLTDLTRRLVQSETHRCATLQFD
jgi:hypothetical protein